MSSRLILHHSEVPFVTARPILTRARILTLYSRPISSQQSPVFQIRVPGAIRANRAMLLPSTALPARLGENSGRFLTKGSEMLAGALGSTLVVPHPTNNTAIITRICLMPTAYARAMAGQDRGGGLW